ncbi:MAG TPA: EthD domain-containing protein [Geminicoccaceae bacterium]|nr:EthD domain-containing protein [Geminicoccaceae bacterium]
MIHKLIFVHPKPGMGERDFFDYWKNVHAVEFGSKIPQVKGYLIDTRVPFGPEPDDPLFSGVAEVWLESEAEELAFLQSKEYVEGARLDEPRFLAFWRMVALDTIDHVLMRGEPPRRDSTLVKLLVLVKRKSGMPLGEFRRYSLETHGPQVLRLPGLRRYVQCHVVDSAYAIGESPLDCVSQLWFDDARAIRRMLESPEYKEQVEPDLMRFIEPKYLNTLVTDEYWVVGPGGRR